MFIDGGHADDVAATDYGTWACFVAPGGLLAIHAFKTLYVADLEAIAGGEDNRAALKRPSCPPVFFRGALPHPAWRQAAAPSP